MVCTLADRTSKLNVVSKRSPINTNLDSLGVGGLAAFTVAAVLPLGGGNWISAEL
jgi:hypothetical protein